MGSLPDGVEEEYGGGHTCLLMEGERLGNKDGVGFLVMVVRGMYV